MSDMLALIIGTGSIGRRHLHNLRRLRPDIRVDVLREYGRSADVADLGGVQVSSTLDQALAKKPGLMIIANPSAMHLRYLVAAIEHGIPFYAEKPVVANDQDLALLREVVGARALPPNIVGCNLRFLPSLQRLKRLIAEGRLGKVVRASFEAGQWLPDWRPAHDYRMGYSARQALGGGVLLDLIHETDAARWLLGEFDRVDAMLARNSMLEIETEDTASLLMRSRDNVLVSVQLDYVSRQPCRRYRIVGDLGTAEWDLPSRTLKVMSPGGVNDTFDDPAEFDVSDTYPRAMQDLLRAIDRGVTTSQPLSEGIASLELVMRARANSAAHS